MNNLSDIPFEILFAGIVIVIAIPIKRFLLRFRMPPRIYSAMVVVALLTCVSAPVVVQSMLKRWPQGKE